MMNEYKKALAQLLLNLGTIIFGGGILALVMKDDNLKEVNFWLVLSGMSFVCFVSIFLGLKIFKKWS